MKRECFVNMKPILWSFPITITAEYSLNATNLNPNMVAEENGYWC